ncbi:MAG: tRNA glutamyl-Q(34) synthetase GluQRS [Ramlibacter sp.]
MYRGRFAPSPTGPLHAGSLVAALASWLDARAHGGQWLVRIEDVDTPRCIPGTDAFILGQLAACGLVPDEPPVWQSRRGPLYQTALDKLALSGRAYPCGCSRKDIEDTLEALGRPHARHAELVYPGICRSGLHGKPLRAWRFLTTSLLPNDGLVPGRWAQSAIENIALGVQWTDRRMGQQAQQVAHRVGDFVLKRADGLWAYQLAVVLDDAAQGVNHVVRGEDLADNTARQILLQRALGLPMPIYLHTPLVLGDNGEKLSKQNGAQALETREPLAALRAAGAVLGLQAQACDVPGWLAQACAAWRGELEYGASGHPN